MKDKYTAVWVSYSSMSDYLKCPRLYFLRNVYRDPKTNHKVSLMQPPLALGQTVHEVFERISVLPSEKRLEKNLMMIYDELWAAVHGQKGGFSSKEEEEKTKLRGTEMLKRVQKNPGPLLRKAVKIRQQLPHFWLSEEENIILCGKIDWIEYIPEDDTVHIIDFKTGKYDEDPDSLQLPMYYLLASACQNRNVSKMSYWYLDRDDAPLSIPLPDAEQVKKQVLDTAKRISVARKLEHFSCKQKDSCQFCRPYEAIVSGSAVYVGVNDFKQDIYVLPK